MQLIKIYQIFLHLFAGITGFVGHEKAISFFFSKNVAKMANAALLYWWD